jgi:hypothetical protein
MNQNISNKNNKLKHEKLIVKTYLTINDLREKDYTNKELSPNERLALKNFDRYRIAELNKQVNENNFNAKYLQLQVMANLSPYSEFLKESYFL